MFGYGTNIAIGELAQGHQRRHTHFRISVGEHVHDGVRVSWQSLRIIGQGHHHRHTHFRISVGAHVRDGVRVLYELAAVAAFSAAADSSELAQNLHRQPTHVRIIVDDLHKDGVRVGCPKRHIELAQALQRRRTHARISVVELGKLFTYTLENKLVHEATIRRL